MDANLNAERKNLLELCESIGGNIKNGDTKGDWDGKPTFVEGQGCSVFDLVIEIENEKGNTVEPRIESDHLPVGIHVGRIGAGKRKRKKIEKRNLG